MKTIEFNDAVFKGVTRVAVALMRTEQEAYELENMIDGGFCQPMNFDWAVRDVEKLLNRYALTLADYILWLTDRCLHTPHAIIYEHALGMIETVIEEGDEALTFELLEN